MTSIFKRGEKSPSRPTSQAGSIINMESNNPDNNLNIHEDEVHNNYISENVGKTLADPIGRLLLNLASTSKALSKKADIPTPNFDLEEISNDYQDLKHQQNLHVEQEIREKKEQLDNLIKNLATSKKFATMETIVPPSFFSPEDILPGNEYKRSYAQNVFPKRPFNPKSPSSPSIAEHLTNLNDAQEDVGLSLAEFKKFLQRSFTGEPYQFISDQIASSLPISDIYTNLFKKYDTRISPYKARDLLLKYIPPSDSTLSSIESDILELGNRAALVHDVASRNACFNTEVISALKKALPRECQEFVLKAEKDCSAQYGRNASFAEFSTSLKVYSDLIDLQLEQALSNKHSKAQNYNRYNNPRHSVNNINYENRRPTYKNNHSHSSYKNYNYNNRHFINNLDIDSRLYKHGSNYSHYNHYDNFQVSHDYPNYNRHYINSLKTETPHNSRYYRKDSNNNNNNYKRNGSPYVHNKSRYDNKNSNQNVQRYQNNYRNNNNNNYVSSRNQSGQNFRNGQYNPQNVSKQMRDQFIENFGAPKYHHNRPNDDNKPKITCPLCGITGHDSTRCQKMRLDCGKLKIQPPTPYPCSICLRASHNKQILHHPEDLCFRRPAFIQAKKEGKHRIYDMRAMNKEYKSRISSA